MKKILITLALSVMIFDTYCQTNCNCNNFTSQVKITAPIMPASIFAGAGSTSGGVRFTTLNTDQGNIDHPYSWDIGVHGTDHGFFLIDRTATGSPYRFYVSTSGNIGIGKATPQEKLDINGGIRLNGTISFNNGSEYYPNIELSNSVLNFRLGASASPIMAISAGSPNGVSINGNLAVNSNIITTNNLTVGNTISTKDLTTSNNLTVSNTINSKDLIVSNNLSIANNLAINKSLSIVHNVIGPYSYSSISTVNQDYSKNWAVQKTDGIDRFFVYGNGDVYASGNVGIGSSPGIEAKLKVKGKILCSEIEVQVNGSIADYVFKPDYKLLNLNEVEAFVKANSHLPEVPSAKEFEEKGMNLMEMNNILLKKVEELTLYIIDLNKKIQHLENKTK